MAILRYLRRPNIAQYQRIFGNQILYAREPPSASSYPPLVNALHRTGNRIGCDCILHSAGMTTFLCHSSEGRLQS